MIPRAFLAIVILTALATPPTSAQDTELSPIEAEVVEWVLMPCMGVRVSLALEFMEEDNNHVVNGRAVTAGVLAVLDGEEAIKKAKKELDGASWSVRRHAYPLMLRQCLKKFAGLK